MQRKKEVAPPDPETPPLDKPSPATDGPWPSYTMVEDKMRRIYFQFYRESYRTSSIDRKSKELIAIAASLAYRCEGCLEGHIKKAIKYGATKEELSETISIAMGVAAASVVDLTDIAAERLKIKNFD